MYCICLSRFIGSFLHGMLSRTENDKGLSLGMSQLQMPASQPFNTNTLNHGVSLMGPSRKINLRNRRPSSNPMNSGCNREHAAPAIPNKTAKQDGNIIQSSAKQQPQPQPQPQS